MTETEELKQKVKQLEMVAQMMTEACYRFFTNKISKEQLKQAIDSLLTDRMRQIMIHRYIIEDLYTDLELSESTIIDND